MRRTLLIAAAGIWPLLLVAVQTRSTTGAAAQLFATSDRCQACHNGLIMPSGADVSIGIDWRASMMAHSARDPYWQAAVRRELLDHPIAAREIEHECSRCHMPMAHVTEVASGGRGAVFTNISPAGAASPAAVLAQDGVSCSTCHQIQNVRLGSPESFTGHFVVDTVTPLERRQIFGPFALEAGLQQLMQSATAFQPAEAAHIKSSELCATCHTLFTHTLDAEGRTIATLPEQVPYLEWRHSSYAATKSCQACHMPVVTEPVPMSSTLGSPRDSVARHTFRGANAWMLRVLNRYRGDLGVEILPRELDAAAQETLHHLATESAAIRVTPVARGDGSVVVEIEVSNRSGHKLPTAYPSRRAWLHVRIVDAAGAVLFESGALQPNGAITGNDNDTDASGYEPHYQQITGADQVQIYEDILADAAGSVTTGLLTGYRYIKDNRLLPDGFDKSTADAAVAVHGAASADSDFAAGGDRIRYNVTTPAGGALTVSAELLYQSIGYRWAQNLRARPAAETDRFAGYYDALGPATAARLAAAVIEIK